MKRIVAALALTLTAPAAAQDDGPARWRVALGTLTAGLARGYANFADTVTDRRVELPSLLARTEASLAAARDDAERRRVFDGLIRALADPHLTIEWVQSGAAAGPASAGQAPCSATWANAGVGGGVRWDRLPGFAAVGGAEGAAFRAGTLDLPGGERVGVLHIRIFMPRAFPDVCAAAAREVGVPPDVPCDDACQERVEGAAGRLLDERLIALVRALEAAGARRLVVDISDNGGGSDWAEAFGRALVGPMAAPRVALVRGPAAAATLTLRTAEAARPPADAPREVRAVLRATRAPMSAAAAEAGVPCDLQGAWRDAAYAAGKPLPCSNLVTPPMYAGSLVRAPAAGSPLVHRAVFYPAIYGEVRDVGTRLPVVLVVDNDTHSAAELLAAMLQDNGKAVLVGVTTAGAGCGHALGGTSGELALPSIGAVVRMPDCVRYRADGTSERRGITPDVLVPWGPSDSAWLRAVKARDAVAGLARAR